MGLVKWMCADGEADRLTGRPARSILVRHHLHPLAPDATLRHFVGPLADERAVGIAAFAAHPTRQHQPRCQPIGCESRLHTLENLDVVRTAETRRTEERFMAAKPRRVDRVA